MKRPISIVSKVTGLMDFFSDSGTKGSDPIQSIASGPLTRKEKLVLRESRTFTDRVTGLRLCVKRMYCKFGASHRRLEVRGSVIQLSPTDVLTLL